MPLTVPDTYSYVLFTAASIGLQCLSMGARYVGTGRRSAFGKDFEEAAKKSGLFDEHKKATGSDSMPPNGYPDMGSGRFAALLPYGAWLDFNNRQRVHQNYVEGAAVVLVELLIAGLYHPRGATIAGLAYIIGREAYSWGYTTKKHGAQGRLVGATIFDVALIALLWMAIGGALKAGGGLAGLASFVRGQ